MSDSIVGNVPDNWNVASLGDLCMSGGGGIQTGPFGSQLHASDYVPIGIPSVMPQNIGDNVIVEDGVARVTVADAQRLSRYLLKAGDIVYSRRGDVERRAFVRPGQDGWLCGTGCLRVRIGNAANARFVSYYLGHPAVRRWVVRHAIGATMPNLNTAILSAVPVVLPPRFEQEEIGELLGALDDKVAINDRLARTALELGSATYSVSMSLPNWMDVVLGQAADWYSGGTPSTAEPTFWNGDIPWISAASLKSPWLEVSGRRVTDLGVANGTRLVPKGSVIFVVRGMSLKAEFRIGVAQRSVAFGQDCKALVPAKGIAGDLLFHAIRSRTVDILDLVDEAGHGTGRLATDRIERMVVRVPSDPNDRINETLRGLNDLAAARQRESRMVTELRDWLLPRLMSGEIRVKDAEKVVEEAL